MCLYGYACVCVCGRKTGIEVCLCVLVSAVQRDRAGRDQGWGEGWCIWVLECRDRDYVCVRVCEQKKLSYLKP